MNVVGFGDLLVSFAFTREFSRFTREFLTFTREFSRFTREFSVLLVSSRHSLVSVQSAIIQS